MAQLEDEKRCIDGFNEKRKIEKKDKEIAVVRNEIYKLVVPTEPILPQRPIIPTEPVLRNEPIEPE